MGTVSMPQSEQTLTTYSTQTAPTASTDIAAVTIVDGGVYLVEIRVGFGGTAEAAGTNLDNFRLMKNGVAHVRLLLNGANAANTGYLPITVQITCAAADVLSVRPVADGTASTIYKASLNITKVGG